MRAFLLVMVLFFSIQNSFTQEYFEEENWIQIPGDYGIGPYITYKFNGFTKDDIAKAKQKLKSIRQVGKQNEWEGIYSDSPPVGDTKLIWNSEGFFSYYFYHELRNLDYGKTKDAADFVELFSEKPTTSKQKKTNKLIKVKFGEKHFLVREDLLRDFAERAAGLERNSQIIVFDYFWSRDDEREKKVFGLPVLPEKYKYFLRRPIETKITRIKNRKITFIRYSDGSSDDYDEVLYSVTIGAGKNKNIKKGMNFFVDDLGEWIEITDVFEKSSIGVIRRDFDENNKEQCRDSELGQGDIIPCREIKVGMKARTKINENSF